jgi:hypothetical protein
MNVVAIHESRCCKRESTIVIGINGHRRDRQVYLWLRRRRSVTGAARQTCFHRLTEIKMSSFKRIVRRSTCLEYKDIDRQINIFPTEQLETPRRHFVSYDILSNKVGDTARKSNLLTYLN